MNGDGKRARPRHRRGWGCLLALSSVAVPFLLLEAVYRGQWVETYAPELRAYNPPDALLSTEDRPTLLAMGDSFTAGVVSYPNALRESRPEWRIVNAGLPGTGIVQSRAICARRLKRFDPDCCVYQVFVGNDLLDLRYPWDGENLSLVRRAYWWLAMRWRSLGFLNYRLAQWSSPNPPAYEEFFAAKDLKTPFSPEAYDARERLYFQAEPHLVESQVRLQGRRAGDYVRWLNELSALRREFGSRNCLVILLVIPHAAQVAPIYIERMGRLGARFSEPAEMMKTDYPFVEGIRRRFAGDSQVIVVDPLPDLQAAEREGRAVYFSNDGHLNRTGQEIVARKVDDVLREQTCGTLNGN